MTDKQIIIDGCDVSGCEWYSSTYFKPCDGCKNTPDCHYKKWQRKEQECEKLKKIIDEAKNSKLDLKSFLVGEAIQNEYEQQLDQLKAENDELKKKCNIYTCGICGNKDDCNKLYRTLTEIKEIISICCSAPNHTDCATYTQCIDCGRLSDEDGFQQILQKISEVEDES